MWDLVTLKRLNKEREQHLKEGRERKKDRKHDINELVEDFKSDLPVKGR